MNSNTADTAISEPETLLSDEEWLEAKRIALRLIRSDELDQPDNHLTYVRKRIKTAIGDDVV